MPRAPAQVLVLPYRGAYSTFEVAVFRRRDYDLWQFVSGGVEEGELVADAARREAWEEAGIERTAALVRLDSTTTIPACWFHAWSAWPTEVLVVPEHAFAVDVGDRVLRLSDEHSEFAWLQPVAAMQRLRFDSNKNALWELQERLAPGPRIKRPAYR
ncbi:MAG: NUDIX domain-containing protein [Myxococcales bacterium FL481]|nr:MAG: NUDIX domain-containing protein [Myxococcales bacterium FL481]